MITVARKTGFGESRQKFHVRMALTVMKKAFDT